MADLKFISAAFASGKESRCDFLEGSDARAFRHKIRFADLRIAHVTCIEARTVVTFVARRRRARRGGTSEKDGTLEINAWCHKLGALADSLNRFETEEMIASCCGSKNPKQVRLRKRNHY